MTAPLRSTPHSQVPASQTAPVAEFRCLYTPDIRKKQKKWHDGYLKFHTFNSRVMVYDQARNFLGDTYYKDSNELHEGDELTLDKGVMVEVAEAMGTTRTDLTPLFEKKPKEAPPPPSAPPRRFQPPSQVTRPQAATSANTARANAQQLRHKSLNSLLGTPKGPIGKSVPIKSPYEARQEKEREKERGKENDFAVDRAAKRQKTTHASASSATPRLSSPVQEKTPALKKTLPLWAKTSDVEAARRPVKPVPEGAPVITLDELDAIAHVSSDPSMPPTPPRTTEISTKPAVTPAPPVRSAAGEKPVLQTPRIPRGKVPVPSVKALETPKVAAVSSSPPVSASNRLTNVDFAIQPTPAKEPARKPSKQPSPPPPAPPSKSPPRQPQPKSLRLSRGVKRGTLMMCQPPPPPPPHVRGLSEARAVATEPKTTRGVDAPKRIQLPASNSSAHFDAAGDELASKAKRKVITDGGDARIQAKPQQAPPEETLEVDDNQEVVHGFMDQQLLLSPVARNTPSPGPILVPDSPEQSPPQPKAAKAIMRDVRKPSPPKTKSSRNARTISPPAPVSDDPEARRKPAQKSKPVREPSPPAALVVKVSDIASRAASPALSVVSDSRSRTTSLSPRKLAVLSSGGFRKKAKRATPQTTPAPEKPPLAPRNETVVLPPHPLRASRKGPVMTTTELAAMLQKPKKRTKTADPIEDEGDTTGVSPNRKFRRVRSENDAPIPSTSEDWEKQNLPKDTDTPPLEINEAPEPPVVVARKKSGLAALIKKTDPRKKFVRTRSLTVETTIPPAQEAESPMVSPVVDKDIGPWSTEAFDLFDWRPPRREDVET